MEQVEDIKAFLGILKILISIVPLFMLQVVSESMLPQFAIHHNLFFKPPGNSSFHTFGHMIRMHRRNFSLLISQQSPLLVVVSLPLYLFLLRSFITYHIPGLLKTILKRIGVGLLLI